MDSKSLSDQEKDIKDLLRRAERTPVKTSALRRDTLKRLIDLAHSSHTTLKTIAATNLKLFIKDFPDLEDDAINAVYDLCEDPVATVRIKGYAAIVDVSREQTKWIKRNADVLVQLLQSDEPEEVTFVKRALTQHLDMDPVVALGVFRDQVVPSDDPLDEEERTIRERLRTLVLTFLAGEAKRPIVERHAITLGSPAEQILVTGLFKAITKLPPTDVDVIVKDILVALPSFKLPSPRGTELLDILLAQIRLTLEADLPAGIEKASLSSAHHYLDLASFVTVDKRLAHPSHLLRFYYTSLAHKSILACLSEVDRAFMINGVARTFAACEQAGNRPPPTAPAADLGKTPGSASDAAEDIALRKQFPDICSVLLQVVADMTDEGQRPWSACYTLVQGIALRKRDQCWEIPQQLTAALHRIQSISLTQEASAEAKAAQEQVHSVIRSLLEPVKAPAMPNASQAGVSSTPGKMALGEKKGNVNHAMGIGAKTGDGHANGTAGTGAARSKTYQRRVMNVNKRKLDASTGSSLRPSGSNMRGNIGRGTLGRPPPASLPPRPSSATVATSFGGAPSAPRADRQRERQLPPHMSDKGPRSSPGTSEAPAAPIGAPVNRVGASVPAESAAADESSGRSAKRPRTEERGRRNRGGRGSGPAFAPSSMQIDGNAAAAQSPASGAGAAGKDASVAARGEDPKPIPSLLSRLAAGALNGKAAVNSAPDRDQTSQDRDRDRGGGRRNRRDSDPRTTTQPVVPSKRRADAQWSPPQHLGSQSAPISAAAPLSSHSQSNPPRSRQRPSAANADRDPVVGFSIRGAARSANGGSSGDGSAGKGPGSLLERLQPQESSGGSDGGRRRKRTKYL